MGNYSSKLLFYNNDQDQKPKSANSDQLVNMEKHLTPPPTRKLGIDPRSATAGIPRTPIEVNNTPIGTFKRISAVPKHLQRKQFLETDIDLVIPPLTPKKCSVTPEILEEAHTPVSLVTSTSDAAKMLKNNLIQKPTIEIDEERYKILRLDPRSPAIDFDRTPILLPKSSERLRAHSPENFAKRYSCDKNTFNCRFSYCESLTVDSVPEIQALPRIQIHTELKNTEDENQEDNKSNSSLSSYSSSIDTTSESGEEITVIRNPNVDITSNKNNIETILSNSDSLLDKEESFLSDKHESSNSEETEVSSEKSEKNNTNLTPIYDKIKVWSDSASSDTTTQDSVITKLDGIKLSEESGSEKSKEDVIILFDDDLDVKNSAVVKAEGDNDNKKTTLGKNKINVRSESKTALEEKKPFSPENKKGVEMLKNRTPLGNRSNNGQKTQKVLGKSPQQLLRNKGMSMKMQQENTPPHRRSVARYHRNGMQWDPDSTVII